MVDNLDGLEPKLLWQHFDEIRKIPRCSKNEEAILAYIKTFADSIGLKWEEDKVGNIIVRKPATSGYENSPTIVLQQHVDMVCEKNSDVQHDFSTDPIKLDIRDGWLYAMGTTLGADNGIGVAATLGILESADLQHGPIEALFTVDEETGLTGAYALEPGFLKGSIMLNMDSEEDGTIYVGCAGGGDTKLYGEFPLEQAPQGWAHRRLVIKGLKGGHSGCDIQEQRGNAVKLLARVLWEMRRDTGLLLSTLSGGDKHNAIPREAAATFYVPNDKAGIIDGMIESHQKALKEEYNFREPDLDLHLKDVPPTNRNALRTAGTIQFLAAITAMPHGVVKMSYDIPDLVETSNNLASASIQDGKYIIHTSSRSNIMSAMESVRNEVESLGSFLGARVEKGDAYPGWKPNLDSNILKISKAIHKDMFGVEAEVKAIHAGLEAGIIGERYPGMDMISVGPQIEHPHSPDERVKIDTCQRFWDFVAEILARSR